MKLISLNVEADNHWDRIHPFLEKERPDVVCFQEAFEEDVATCAERLGMAHAFTPMIFKTRRDGVDAKFGIAILSRLPMSEVRSQNYYVPTPDLAKYDVARRRETIRQSLLSASIPTEQGPMTIATTHFTWTPDGLPTKEQDEDAKNLLKLLSGFSEIVLCGDFNVPRGVDRIYEQFTAQYTDAIPASYVSSLDMDIHQRVNPMERQKMAGYMVDYFFLSKGYVASDVHLESGVSDHMAVIGEINLCDRV